MPLGFISTSFFAKAVPCRCLTTTVCLGSSATPDRHKLRRPSWVFLPDCIKSVPGSFSFRRLKLPKTMAAFDHKQDHLKTTRWDTPIWKKLQVLPSNHRVRSFPLWIVWLLACYLPLLKAYFQLAKKSASQQFPSYLGNVHCYHVKHAVLHWSHIWICLISLLLNGTSHISVITRIRPTREDPNHQKKV